MTDIPGNGSSTFAEFGEIKLLPFTFNQQLKLNFSNFPPSLNNVFCCLPVRGAVCNPVKSYLSFTGKHFGYSKEYYVNVIVF